MCERLGFPAALGVAALDTPGEDAAHFLLLLPPRRNFSGDNSSTQALLFETFSFDYTSRTMMLS